MSETDGENKIVWVDMLVDELKKINKHCRNKEPDKERSRKKMQTDNNAENMSIKNNEKEEENLTGSNKTQKCLDIEVKRKDTVKRLMTHDVASIEEVRGYIKGDPPDICKVLLFLAALRSG